LAFDHGRVRRTAEVLLVTSQLLLWGLVVTRLPHGAAGPEQRFRPLLEQASGQSGGVVLGAFDAGALGYVARLYPDVTVVNLDGLVNNAVYDAVRQERYLQYVTETVDYLVQDPGRARMFLAPDQVDELRRHFQKAP
jgi:hypothetical protein